MIQRIQSAFLFLAALCLGLLFIFPVVAFSFKGLEVEMYLTRLAGVGNGSSVWCAVLSALVIAVMVILLVSLFSYKRRPRQIKLCTAAFFLEVIFMGILFLVPDLIAKRLDPDPVKVSFQWACFLPIASMAFTWLANKYIRKDEALVRSADRLR